MTATSLIRATAAEQAAALAAGEVSTRELTRAHLDRIAAVDGVNAIFVGPGDLSHSYGMPGLGLSAPPVMAAVRRAIAAGRAHGLPVCTVPVPGMDAATVTDLRREGLTVVIWGVDLVLVGRHFRSIVDSVPRD